MTDTMITDKTGERLAESLSAAVELEGVSNEALDKCRVVTGSKVLQRELLRRAIKEGERKVEEMTEARCSMICKLARQRAEMAKLEA